MKKEVKKMKKQKNLIVAFAITAMFLCSSIFAVATAQSNEEPIGKEFASTIRELTKAHQSDIKDFILETKVDMAETNEERLAIIDNYVNEELRATIEEVKAKRQQLITQLEAGEINVEEFTVEMKALSQEIATTSKTMGQLGEQLGTYGQNLAEANKERAQQIVSGLQEFKQDMTQTAQTLGNQMSEKGLNIPEMPPMPQIPEIPQIPQQPTIPNKP
jgi:dsDNA-specific endonuclease/ATPase MutS2